MSIESCYEIPPEVLSGYSVLLDGADQERTGLIVTLCQLGLSPEKTREFLYATAEEKLRQLSWLRNTLLAGIHESEEQLSRLDYLRYRLMQENESDT